MEQTITRNYQYTHKQVSLLTKSMLIAGLCFLAVCGGAWGFSELFYQNVRSILAVNSAWFPIFLLLILVGMVISMLWIKILSQKKAIGWTIFVYALYISIMSVAFGYLFALVRLSTNNGLTMLALAFGITGGIFLLAALMSKIMSAAGVFTFTRLIMACGFAMLILLIVNLTLGIVGSCSPSIGIFQAYDATFFLIMIALSIVVFAYMVIDMWVITKSEEFLSYIDAEAIPSSYVWYCGYKLLVDLLNLFLIVIWFILRLARRAN